MNSGWPFYIRNTLGKKDEIYTFLKFHTAIYSFSDAYPAYSEVLLRIQ